MEGVWKYFLTILLAVSGSCSHITEGPQNATVLEGSEARFNCTVSRGWQLILWYINNQVSLSITVNGPIISSDRIVPKSYQSGDSFTTEMIIRDVRRSDSGKIKCGLQNSSKEETAFLSVQEGDVLSNTFPTWAIILLAVGLPLLLILVIILVVLFCCGCSCKKRKEASYQSKIRNLSISKPNDGPIQAMGNNGKENYGYSSDEPRNTKISSPPSVTSNFSASRQGGQVRLPHQINEEQQQVRTARSTPTVYPSHPRKIRNATLV
ncbi:immunoglobulin superfamily member 5 isoform X3 [Ornithorhynchus anatinus]|uniref:immunoglobulin superfamily member 5 isoform X3 n=1 Tax=Ornithorhynchus anatinus TaxID=9258 RepID=UPI0007AA75C9|nr:immunoglobulin superfamily member 5 isoform X3 [Ornithorhynchus anatinus]